MTHTEPIYLDYAATTPVSEAVLAAMLPYFRTEFGNPSSVHRFGQRAEAALDAAKQKTADCLNASPAEVLFTGCGTESDNLALRGLAHTRRKTTGANRLVISPVEHHAVLHTAQQLAAEEGFVLDVLPVDSDGRVDPAEVARRLALGDTALVSVIYANNEIGTINPIAEIGGICRAAETPFHSDAVQAAAHLKMDVARDQVDLLSLGAHKFYGPKGVGALYARKGIALQPVQTGGKQEGGLRAGTQNIPYIVGLAEAFLAAQTDVEARAAKYTAMRDELVERVRGEISGARLTGHPTQRLPNHASFVFDGVDGNLLLMMLDAAGFACSSGSACKTGSPSPSEVLLAIGLPPALALGSLRVTLGSETTPAQVTAFADVLPGLVEKVRKLSR